MTAFLERFGTRAWTLFVPLTLLLVLAPASFFLISEKAGWIVGNLGTVLVIIGNVLYVVFWRSKKRWPDVSASERFLRLMSCSR